MRLRCAKKAERIDVPFGVETFGDPRHIVLVEGCDSPTTTQGSMRPLPSYFCVLDVVLTDMPKFQLRFDAFV